MNNMELFTTHLARAINDAIRSEFDNVGFALLLFEFNEPGITNYASNANREDIIKSLRETAEILEKHEDMLKTLPGVQ